MNKALTEDQRSQVDYLQNEFGIDPSRVRFFEDGRPWLSSRDLIQIARQTGEFKTIVEGIDKSIPEFNQVAHYGRVTDNDGFTLQLVGVATLGETLWDGSPVDEHELAGSRALVSVLDAMGVNPFKPGKADSAQKYLTLVKGIHAVAREADLIQKDEDGLLDTSGYKEFVRQWSKRVIGREVSSCAGLPWVELQSLLAALREYKQSNVRA